MAELQRLLSVAPRRALVYLVAALTGLRRKELRLLQWGDILLDHVRPHVVLRAATTKSRRGDTIALNDEVAEALRGARPSGWRPTDAVFKSVPKSSTFRRDLERAGIPVEVDGKKLDFHALRTTFGTLLATSGAGIRESMEQMRHTDVRLTLRTYTDPRLVDIHGAVNRIPRISSTPRQDRERATGTFDATPSRTGPDIRSNIREKVTGR